MLNRPVDFIQSSGVEPFIRSDPVLCAKDGYYLIEKIDEKDSFSTLITPNFPQKNKYRVEFGFIEINARLSPVICLNSYSDVLHKIEKEFSDFPPIITVDGIVVKRFGVKMTTGMHGILVSGAIAKSKQKQKTYPLKYTWKILR
jgi:hypothetical protein